MVSRPPLRQPPCSLSPYRVPLASPISPGCNNASLQGGMASNPLFRGYIHPWSPNLRCSFPHRLVVLRNGLHPGWSFPERQPSPPPLSSPVRLASTYPKIYYLLNFPLNPPGLPHSEPVETVRSHLYGSPPASCPSQAFSKPRYDSSSSWPHALPSSLQIGPGSVNKELRTSNFLGQSSQSSSQRSQGADVARWEGP
ncbi:hypothetical protein FNV43_RR02709 [Rhamnella rubrinervis]|uniref:Uncharacterized protein n=1 Tax=Rhamnella rubrinervis TaxID=2594499 RepID=A0A8K0HGZ9_9ROSA|nr:hypothetical protein FNV43_RR02709 [Rhamnella rubrinervis]